MYYCNRITDEYEQSFRSGTDIDITLHPLDHWENAAAEIKPTTATKTSILLKP